jgi:hypothetical protein
MFAGSLVRCSAWQQLEQIGGMQECAEMSCTVTASGLLHLKYDMQCKDYVILLSASTQSQDARH